MKSFVSWAAFLVLASEGCAPMTQYRYTGMIPAPRSRLRRAVPGSVAAYMLGGDVEGYSLANTGTDSDWTLAIGVYPSYSFGPDGRCGTLFAMLGAHTSFKNDGFTNVYSSGSTITQDGFVPITGIGYGIHAPYFHVNMMAYLPFTMDSTRWGPGMMLTVGLDLPVWKPHVR